MIDREKIRNRFGGRCAYCGKYLGERWHADHVAPIYRGWADKPRHAGVDDEENLFPACPRCNLRKMTLSVEDFRKEIAAQVDRLRRDSPAFRLAEDFGLIMATGNRVQFYFEKPPSAPDAGEVRSCETCMYHRSHSTLCLLCDRWGIEGKADNWQPRQGEEG